VAVEQTYSDYRKGKTAKLDSLGYLALTELKVVDLDTASTLAVTGAGASATVPLEVPITNDKQSAHLRISGVLKDSSYKVANDELVFDRTMRGLRNTVVLPAGWELSGASQSATIGTWQGRTFVAFINLNAENSYRIVIRARKAK
jgi:hypothetical protein